MEFSTVAEHLRRHFGVEGTLSALGSCEDLNFKLKSVTSALNPEFSAGKYVVKYIRSRGDESVEKHIKVQHNVMQHLNGKDLPYRCPLPAKCLNSNDTTVPIQVNGIDYIMHVLAYQDGGLLSEQKYFSPFLLESFGEMIATLSDAMKSTSVTTDRKTQWDMQTAYELIQSYATSMSDSSKREKIISMTKEMNDIVVSHQSNLRVQLVHADLAPYNVLVNSKQKKDGQPIIGAIIDFGDVSESWLVAEIAVGLSPLLVPPECDLAKDGFSDDHHPLRTTLLVLRGFLKKTQLNRNEAISLWPLIILRGVLLNLAVLKLLETDTENDYLKKEIVENERLMEALMAIPAASAIAAILELCGFSTTDNENEKRSQIACPVNLSFSSPYSKIDLSCLSDTYKYSGEWNEETNVVAFLNRKTAPIVIPLGVPWLIRCKRNIPDIPRSYPTFVTLGSCNDQKVSFADACQVASDRTVSVEDPLYEQVLLALGITTSPFVISTVIVAANRDWAVRILTICDNSELISSRWSSADGRLLSKGEEMCIKDSQLVLLQALQLRSDVFTTLLDHQVLYQPLHINIQGDSRRDNQHIFPPLFVTHFDWKYLWRRLSLDPLLVGEVSDSDQYESLRDTAMYARDEYLGALQEHYYDVDELSLLPPLILRGDRAHLLSHTGRPLLDMVNNVAVVGHSHPAVLNAAVSQLTMLNTNSRFVYPGLGAFAEEIVTKTVPEHVRHQLNRIVFVNSGSEATDLALRIARTVVSHRRWQARKQHHQQGGEERVPFRWFRDVICMRGGYHGITTASDEVSTTLNDNPLALETRPEHVHLAPMPNLFRGLYTKDRSSSEADSNAGFQVDPTPEEEELLAAKYADHIEQMVEELLKQDRAPTAFIAEPLSGNAGGVCLPRTYLSRVYSILRRPSIGALCICDEVQTGYGRLGHGFWGFQSPENEPILPDIVTVAKAAGNGHPLGYVITSQGILDEFYQAQGSFFSSAGGGPVSCAIGRAVLRTVQDEQLQQHSAEVGQLLSVGLRALQKKHPHIIGYIHGYGLYQGVEIIACDQGEHDNGRRPGTREARLICRRLLDLGIICHNTGDYSNVLKVKPPLVFSKEDAEYFMAMLDKICTEGW